MAKLNVVIQTVIEESTVTLNSEQEAQDLFEQVITAVANGSSVVFNDGDGEVCVNGRNIVAARHI